MHVTTRIFLGIAGGSPSRYYLTIQWGFLKYNSGGGCAPVTGAVSGFAFTWYRDCADGTGVMTLQGQDFTLSYGSYAFLPCFSDAPSCVITVTV